VLSSVGASDPGSVKADAAAAGLTACDGRRSWDCQRRRRGHHWLSLLLLRQHVRRQQRPAARLQAPKLLLLRLRLILRLLQFCSLAGGAAPAQQPQHPARQLPVQRTKPVQYKSASWNRGQQLRLQAWSGVNRVAHCIRRIRPVDHSGVNTRVARCTLPTAAGTLGEATDSFTCPCATTHHTDSVIHMGKGRPVEQLQQRLDKAAYNTFRRFKGLQLLMGGGRTCRAAAAAPG
jgi:hypothetical protein